MLIYSDVLSNCYDFLHEEMALQALGTSLGTSADRTTKCHPETTGGGIEYNWGQAQQYYHSSPIQNKRGKDDCRNLVQASLCTDTGSGASVDKEVICKFSQWARQYIVACFQMEHSEIVNDKDVNEINIKALKKKYKTHQSAVDFDTSFITHSLKLRVILKAYLV